MPKEELKEQVRKIKGTNCSISNVKLPAEHSLYDTHRSIPKKDGGTYTLQNTNLAMPVAHMALHGNLREREEEELDYMKTLMDDRNQIMKLRIKIENQLRANKRGTDKLQPHTKEFLESQLKDVTARFNEISKSLDKFVRQMKNPIVRAGLAVPSVGPITMAGCLTYINLEKARHASSLWAYVGLDKPKHERYQKGVKGGGNRTLRCILFNMAESQWKQGGPYKIVGERLKERLAISEKEVKTKNTEGNWEVKAWKDVKPSHRHGAAIRVIMKHFLADYWMVGRTILGLPTSPLYPEAVLGGTHKTIMPEERGWVY